MPNPIPSRPYTPLLTGLYVIGPILIIVSHMGSLLVLVTGLSLGSVMWMIGWYLIRMLATTGIYHRLLTHKSYTAPRWFLRLGCLVGASAGQMGPSWWKAHHLSHHKYSDQPLDTHSPVQNTGWKGFIWSQGGWLLSPNFFPEQLPLDVEADPVLKLIDRLHFLPLLALGGMSYILGGLEYLSAFFLSTTLLFHGVQTVNSLSHLWGSQPFSTTDHSRNNGFVAFLTLGEGWHNLHHAFPASSRHGITLRDQQVVYLIDPTFGFICLLERLSLATKVKHLKAADLLARDRQQSPMDSAPVKVPTLTR